MPRTKTSRALSPAERMRRYRERRRRAGLRVVTHWVPRAEGWSDHRIVEARSLAMHVQAARRIARDPSLLSRLRATMGRWLERHRDRPPPALVEWRALLERPWEEVLGRVTALNEDGARLRQSSPLPTLLEAAERRRIHDAFRA